MGNWASGVASWWTAPASPPTTGPTADDYQVYTNDLLNIKEFICVFVNEEIPRCRARLRRQELGGDDFGQALKLKDDQLKNIRVFVGKRVAALGRNSELPTGLKVLRDQLDDVQPLFDVAVRKFETLSRDAEMYEGDAAAAVIGGNDPVAANPSAPVESVVTPTVPGLHGDDAIEMQLLIPQTQHNDSDSDNENENELRQLPKGTQTLEDWINGIEASLPPTVMTRETEWTVDRSELDQLDTIFDRYKTAKLRQLQLKLLVKFKGERGIDRGALTREFFSTTLQTAISGMFKGAGLFQGEVGHMLPDATTDYLVYGFKYLGMLIAHAVRNGCHGLSGMSPAIQHYLIHGKGLAFIERTDPPPPMSLEDVADIELRKILFKLHEHTDLSEEELGVLSTWMDHCNCRLVLNQGTSQLIVQTLLVYYIFKSRSSQIEALMEGLDTLDLHQFLRQNPTLENMSRVFPPPTDMDTTPSQFMQKVITRGTEFDDGTLEMFRQFLSDVHSGTIPGKKIADVVQFLSGSPYLPSRVVISFRSDIVYPVAHSCFNELELPMACQGYSAFRDAMIFSLDHGMGFTLD